MWALLRASRLRKASTASCGPTKARQPSSDLRSPARRWIPVRRDSMRIGTERATRPPGTWQSCGRHLVLAVLLVGLTGCVASPQAQTDRGAASTSSPSGASGPKVITVALPIDPIALGGGLSGSGLATVPSRYFREFTNAYLTTYDPQDEAQP